MIRKQMKTRISVIYSIDRVAWVRDCEQENRVGSYVGTIASHANDSAVEGDMKRRIIRHENGVIFYSERGFVFSRVVHAYILEFPFICEFSKYIYFIKYYFYQRSSKAGI